MVTSATRSHDTARVYAGLLWATPGPASARACWECAHGTASERHGALDGAAARARYSFNRTDADTAKSVIAVVDDPDFLHDVVLHEKRRSLVAAALDNPSVTLPSVIVALTGKGSAPVVSLNDEGEILDAAAARYVASNGLDATISVLLDAGGSFPHRFRSAARRLPGVAGNVDAVRRLCREMADMPNELARIGTRDELPSDAVLDVLVREASIRTAVETVRYHQLDWSHPDLVDVALARCLGDPCAPNVAAGSAHPSDLDELGSFIAGRPHRGDLYPLLATLATQWTKASLASNRCVPAEVFTSVAVCDDDRVNGQIVGRLLAEQCGDDATAFTLAGQLLAGFQGTYGELCDLVRATLR